jgi:hypothetical protein
MMISALYKPNTISWVFIELVHWNNSPRVDLLLHSDTLFYFQANQTLLFLLNVACLVKKQQMPILQSLIWPDRDTNTRREHNNHITPQM